MSRLEKKFLPLSRRRNVLQMIGIYFKKLLIFREPLWVFPFEAMEAVAVHLMWVAAATYCAVIAPRNLLATLIGVVGMAHFSLGKYHVICISSSL